MKICAAMATNKPMKTTSSVVSEMNVDAQQSETDRSRDSFGVEGSNEDRRVGVRGQNTSRRNKQPRKKVNFSKLIQLYTKRFIRVSC